MQPNNPNQKKRQIKVEQPKDLTATYANLVMISHSPQEYIFDFIQMLPPHARAKVEERIVMSPTHAKLFLRALQDNIEKYEARFGEINVPPTPVSLADQLFRSVAGDDAADDDGDDTDDTDE